MRETTLASLGIHESVLLKLDRRPPPPVSSTAAAPKPPPPPSAHQESTASMESAAPGKFCRHRSLDGCQLSTAARSPPFIALCNHTYYYLSASSATQSPPSRIASQPTSYSQMPQGESISLMFPTGSGGGTPAVNEPFSIFAARPSRSIFDQPEEPQRKYERVSSSRHYLCLLVKRWCRRGSLLDPTTSRESS